MTINTIIAQQGWSDATVSGLLLRFIEDQGLNEALAKFLESQADFENDQSGDTDQEDEEEDGEEHEYDVEVVRTGYAVRTIRVTARSVKEARQIAEEHAGNESFSEHSSDYDADTVTKVE